MVPGRKENQSACEEFSELLFLLLHRDLTIGQRK